MPAFSILFENDEILLINKPNGVPVQGGQGISHPLDDELSKQVGYRVHLVHRLDKETAGILVVAKTGAAASKWTQLIGTKQVVKEYTAICFGSPALENGKQADSGTLQGKVEAHGRVQVALTHFEVEKKSRIEIPEDEQGRSLEMSKVHITLGTGRMHQIRIQFAKAEAPLVADDQHGNFKANKLARKIGAKKLCLAATRLTIPLADPETGKTVQRIFEVPLPDHMQKLLEKF